MPAKAKRSKQTKKQTKKQTEKQTEKRSKKTKTTGRTKATKGTKKSTTKSGPAKPAKKKAPARPKQAKPARKKAPAKTKQTKPARKKTPAKTKQTKPARKKTPAKTKQTKPARKKAPAKTKQAKPAKKKAPAKTKQAKPAKKKAPAKNETRPATTAAGRTEKTSPAKRKTATAAEKKAAPEASPATAVEQTPRPTEERQPQAPAEPRPVPETDSSPQAPAPRPPKPEPPEPSPVELLLADSRTLEFVPFDPNALDYADLLSARALPGAAEELLLSETDRAAFRQAVADRAGLGMELAREFQATFGWPPPAELAVWSELEAGLRRARLEQEPMDGWLLSLDVCQLDQDSRERRNFFAWTNGAGLFSDPLALFSGLFRLGRSIRGETALACLLPADNGLISIWSPPAGPDSPAQPLAGGLSHFFLQRAVAAGVYGTPEFAAWVERLDASLLPALERRPLHRDPLRLAARSDWLAALITHGRIPRAFDERLAQAPDWKQWERERELLTDEPQLANYWPMAHWFMGNDGACREALASARKGGGRVSARLADLVGRLLDGARLDVGAMAIGELDRLRRRVRRGLRPEQVEPGGRERLEAFQRRRPRAGVDPQTIEAALSEGADALALLREHPRQVELHQRLLQAAAAADPALADALARVEALEAQGLEASAGAAEEALDARLGQPLAAAFIAGLAFAHDHPSARSGLAPALARLDDDWAQDAWAAAIRRLEPGDPRLGFAVRALIASRRPGAREMLENAARRFFDELDAALESMQDRLAHHPALAGPGAAPNHLIAALEAMLEPADSAAERMVRKVLAMPEAQPALRSAWGCAARVAAQRGLTDQTARLLLACRTAVENDWGAHPPDDVTVFNLAESALAAARLDPLAAGEHLSAMLAEAAERTGPVRAGLTSGLLAGLLPLQPGDTRLLGECQRVLGDRSRPRAPHLYGALRGLAAMAENGKVPPAAAGWVAPHAIDGLDGPRRAPSQVGRAAREALRALGRRRLPRPQPEADPAAADPQALLEQLTAPGAAPVAALEHIRAEGLQPAGAAERIGDWLAEQLRYSADQSKPYQEHCWTGLGALWAQGRSALGPLAAALSLEHLHGEWIGPLLRTMRSLLPEAEVRAFLLADDHRTLLETVRHPAGERLGWLDLLAGWLALDPSPAALAAVSAACAWRFRTPDDLASRTDPVARRLPLVLASFGERARPDLERLQQATAGHAAEEAFVRAREALQLWESGGLPLDLFDGQRQATLRFADAEAADRCRLELRLIGGRDPGVEIHSSEALDLRGWLDHLDYRERLARPDLAAARQLASQLLHHAFIIGYRLAD
jgi:hypothetical protein